MTSALPAKTLVDYFRFAAASGKAELLVSKVDGVWTPLSADEFGARTRSLALGLALLGKKPGDHVKVKSGGTEHDYAVTGISRYVDTLPAAGR